MLETLTKLGFSSKEAQVYLVLIKYGTRQTSFLARKAGLNRGTTYVILHQLLERGLAAKSVKRKVQYFTALDPQRLVTRIDQQAADLVQQRQTAAKLIEELRKVSLPGATQPKIEYFEGRDGARTALRDTLTSKEKLLRAFLSLSDIGDYLGAEFFDRYTDDRVGAGLRLRALRTLEKDKEAIARNQFAKRYSTNAAERREIRHISDELAFPMSMYLYDSKILAVSSKEENFALLIESEELCSMQKKLFELLWASAEARPATAAVAKKRKQKRKRKRSKV